jgi:hypothetical protein
MATHLNCGTHHNNPEVRLNGQEVPQNDQHKVRVSEEPMGGGRTDVPLNVRGLGASQPSNYTSYQRPPPPPPKHPPPPPPPPPPPFKHSRAQPFIIDTLQPFIIDTLKVPGGSHVQVTLVTLVQNCQEGRGGEEGGQHKRTHGALAGLTMVTSCERGGQTFLTSVCAQGSPTYPRG